MLNQDMNIFSDQNPIFIYKREDIYEPIFYKTGRDFEKNDGNLNISRNEKINMIMLYIKTKIEKFHDNLMDIEDKLKRMGYKILKYYLNKLSQIEYLIISKDGIQIFVSLLYLRNTYKGI